MKILTQYLGRQLVRATLMACLLLVGVDYFFSLMNELKYMGTGDYGVLQAIAYLLFLLPQKLYELFPPAMLLGGIMGLGLMASNSELVAMRASGISYRQILLAMLKVGFILALLIALMGEFVVPLCERVANKHRAYHLTGGQALLTDNGTWMRDGNTFVHIRELSDMGHVEGVTRYMFTPELILLQASHAKEAYRQDKGWLLYDVQDTYFEHDRLHTTHESRSFWGTDLDPDVLRVLGLKTLDQLPVRGLLKALRFRQENNLNAVHYELALWGKIFRPVVTLIMLVLGLMCVFGPLRQANFGLRMLVGILLGFGFFVFHELASAMGALYSMPTWFMVMLPSLFFGALVWLQLKRLRF